MARLLAVLAMVMQVLVATAHLGAEAARASGVSEPDVRLGFLEICTGQGIIIIGPSGSTQSGGSTASCAVCASACAYGFDQPVEAAEVSDAAFVEAEIVVLCFAVMAEPVRFLSDGPIRAPPLFAQV